MLDMGGRLFKTCAGVTRRSLLKAGAVAMAGLTLPDLLRRQHAAASVTGSAVSSEKSLILIWLDGGPPHHETYDPKPDAPTEFRGPLGSIETAIPGVRLSELLPRHAAILDKVSLIRTMHHRNGDHFAAAHWMLTGFLGSNAVNLPPVNPSAPSVIAKLKGPRTEGLPAYVGLPHTHSVGLAPGYHGAAYLGVAYNPFTTNIDPNQPGYQVPNLNLPDGVTIERMSDRRQLLNAFDQVRREADAAGMLDGLDEFTRRAFEMVTGPRARAAFDISGEDPKLRDRYGRHQWGQCALVARRLVEAGVRCVTLTFDGWDWHSTIKEGMERQLPIIDAAIATLITDLDARGLLETTMVVVMGEFGRTPRINATAGRDHWGDAMSVLIGGGGVRPGVVVGSTNVKGEVPRDRPVPPADLIVTIYHHMGIDPATTFHNHAGRPIPIGNNGRVIDELC